MRNETKYFIWSSVLMDYIEVSKEVYEEFILSIKK